jgi:hypothetical protein
VLIADCYREMTNGRSKEIELDIKCEEGGGGCVNQ